MAEGDRVTAGRDLDTVSSIGDDRLAELTAQFLAGRRSDHTRAAYRLDLASWFEWCRDVGLHPTAAWPGDVMRWLAVLNERGEAGTTRARRLSAASSWYRWLIRHQAADRNPAILDRNERPVLAPRRAPALSDAQVEGMLTAADAEPNLRSAAIVWLMLTTGVRVGEVTAADVADLGQDRGVNVLHVRGKGGKSWPVEVEPYTMGRVQAYLAGRTDVDLRPALPGQVAGASRPLFATASGQRMQRKEVRRLLIRVAQAAGLPPDLIARLTNHSTRATFITTSLEAGVPVRDVQRAVGHASPLTTEGYDRSAWAAQRSPSRRVADRFHAARVDALRNAGEGEHD